MTGTINLNEQLKHYFGFDSFKGEQESIISNLLEGNDTFVLMPTGGGKSLCYQLPSLIMDGTAIVVSPLIALMKNQVDVINGLSEESGVAHYLNSSLNKAAINQVRSDIYAGRTKLLYVAPESLNKEDNLDFFRSFKISFYAVDEAHCISEWGHDFRPEYRNIRPTIQKIGNAPVIALTATATDKVRMDIKKSLGITEAREFRSSFNRPNLYYEVRQKSKDIDRQIIKFIKQHHGKSGIVYCISRKKVEDLAAVLKANEIKAAPYHAGLDSATRSQTQDDFLMERIDVIVATIAFGMGIDKPDVRVVIHYDCPNSIEAYFQEAGRAGRDGNKAYAVLLYNASDNKRLLKRIAEEYPDKETVVKIYEHLAYYLQIAANTGYGHTFQLDVDRFARTFKHFPTIVNSALRILSRAGYIHYETDPDSRTRLRFLLDRDQLYILNDSSPDEEAVISVALREYSGMFTDYRYIDESRIAQLSGVPVNKVYLILKSLNQRRIVHFIPQRTVPLVTYTRDRELPENVVIPTSVYEDRKKLFEWHIKQMLLYAMNNNVCRSRQLLRYFGEEQTADCGKCDVCLARKNENQTDTDAKDARQKILELLSDGEWHQKTELLKIDAPKEAVSNAIRYLVLEELISIDHAKVRAK